MCAAPPEGGVPIATTILATFTCLSPIVDSLAGTQQALEQALSQCGTEVPTPVFEQGAVAVFTFPDRPTATLREAVSNAGAVYFTLESDAYCGGPAPGYAVVVAQLAGVAAGTDLKNELCTRGECSGPPAP